MSSGEKHAVDALEVVVPGASTAPLPDKLITTIWKAGHPSFAGGSEKFTEPTKAVEAWPQTWKGLVRRIERGQKLPRRDDKRLHPHLGLYWSPEGFRSNREGDVTLRTGLHIDIDEGATEESGQQLVEVLSRWGLAAIVQRRDALEPERERKLRAILPLLPDDGRETFYSRASAFLIALSETIGCPIDLAPAVWSQPTFIYGPVIGREKPRIIALLDGHALDLSKVEGTTWGRRVSGENCPDAVKLCRAMFAEAGCTFDGDRCTRPPDGDNPSSIEFMPDGGFRCWTKPTYAVRAWLKANVSEAYDRWWQHPGRRVERARSTLRTREARVEGERHEIGELATLLKEALQGGQHVFELPKGTNGLREAREAFRALDAATETRVIALPDPHEGPRWNPSTGPGTYETTHAMAFAYRAVIDRLVIVGRCDAVQTLALPKEKLEGLRRTARDALAKEDARLRRVRTAFEYIVEDLFFSGHLHMIPEWTLPDRSERSVDAWISDLLAAPSDADDERPEHLDGVMEAALRRSAVDDFDVVDAERIARRLLELGGTVEAHHDDDELRVVCIPEWTQRSFVMLADSPDRALEQVCPSARWIRFEQPDQCTVERVWYVTAPMTSVNDDAAGDDDGISDALRALWKHDVEPLIANAGRPLVCMRHPTGLEVLRSLGYEGALCHAGDGADGSLEAHDLLVILGAPLPEGWHPEANAKTDAPRDPGFWRAMEDQVEGAIRSFEERLRLREGRATDAPPQVRIWYFGPSFPSPPWREDECEIVAT